MQRSARAYDVAGAGRPTAGEVTAAEAAVADAPRVPYPQSGSRDDQAEHLPASTTLRVAVTSDQRLLADMGAAALAGVGVHATAVDWPGRRPTDAFRRRLLAFRPHVCLGLVDPSAARVDGLVSSGDLFPWVVLATGEAGPSWGAALDAGAHAVLPGRLSLPELVSALRHSAVRDEVMDPDQRAEVVQAWNSASEHEQRLVARMNTLTPREAFVLRHLYEGKRVGTIAGDSGVSEATVRSQVKSVLRKLGVDSQIAAVAAYRHVRELVSETVEARDDTDRA